MAIKIHIGQLIQQKMKEDGRTTKWLAKQIGCDPSIISRMYRQKHPAKERLTLVCIHLKINLFIHYVDYVNERILKADNTI